MPGLPVTVSGFPFLITLPIPAQINSAATHPPAPTVSTGVHRVLSRWGRTANERGLVESGGLDTGSPGTCFLSLPWATCPHTWRLKPLTYASRFQNHPREPECKWALCVHACVAGHSCACGSLGRGAPQTVACGSLVWPTEILLS